MNSGATLVHFRNNCIGCASCVELAPEHWLISKSDGKATLIKSLKKNESFVKPIHEIEIEENQIAADACPVNIIQVNLKSKVLI